MIYWSPKPAPNTVSSTNGVGKEQKICSTHIQAAGDVDVSELGG